MNKAVGVVTIVAIIAVAGSITYYYTVALPQQNAHTQQDISAIRSVIAPTQEEQQTYLNQLSAGLDCIKRQSETVRAQCHSDSMDLKGYDKWGACVAKVRQQYSC